MAAQHDLEDARRDLAIRSAEQQAEVEAFLTVKPDPLQQLREQLLAAEASMGGSAAMKRHLQKQADGSQSPSPRISTNVHHPLVGGDMGPPTSAAAAATASDPLRSHPLDMQQQASCTTSNGVHTASPSTMAAAFPSKMGSSPCTPISLQKSPPPNSAPNHSPLPSSTSQIAMGSPIAANVAASPPSQQAHGMRSPSPLRSKSPIKAAMGNLLAIHSSGRAMSPMRNGGTAAAASPAAAAGAAAPRSGSSPYMQAKPASRILSPVRTLKALVSGSKHHHNQPQSQSDAANVSPHSPSMASTMNVISPHQQTGVGRGLANSGYGLTSPTARQPYTSMLAGGMGPGMSDTDPSEEWLISPTNDRMTHPAALPTTPGSYPTSHASATPSAGALYRGASPHGGMSPSRGMHDSMSPSNAQPSRAMTNGIGGGSPMKGRLLVDLPSGLHDPTLSATPAVSASPLAETAAANIHKTHSHTTGLMSTPHRSTTPSAGLDNTSRPSALRSQPTAQPASGSSRAAAAAAASSAATPAARPSSAISRMRARALATTASKSIGTSSESSTPRASPTAALQQGNQNLTSPLTALSESSNGGSPWRGDDRSREKGVKWDKENLAPDFFRASDDSVNLATSPYSQA